MSKKKSLTELRADVEKGAQRKKFYENEIKIKERTDFAVTAGCWRNSSSGRTFFLMSRS